MASLEDKNVQIITNNEKQNHMGKIVQMAEKADIMIVVSAFISGNLSEIFESMPSIKEITIYTNISGYDDGADKIIALYEFSKYCKEKKIDLLIKSDDQLHGKVYLFYKKKKNAMPESKGFIISSGNFTKNGMRNNHEFGAMVYDEAQQLILSKMVNELKTYEITEQQLSVLVEKARMYKEEIKTIKPIPTFKVDNFVNLKPSKQENIETKYFIKPIGTADKPFEKGRVLKERDKIGFGELMKNIKQRDVFLCHATGPQMIVGYYMVDSKKQYWEKNDEEDRWPYKFDVICKSVPFSENWWNYELKTKKIIEEFLEKNPGLHITKSGGDTIGTLNFGSEKVEITKEFAKFIIDKIPEVKL